MERNKRELQGLVDVNWLYDAVKPSLFLIEIGRELRNEAIK